MDTYTGKLLPFLILQAFYSCDLIRQWSLSLLARLVKLDCGALRPSCEPSELSPSYAVRLWCLASTRKHSENKQWESSNASVSKHWTAKDPRTRTWKPLYMWVISDRHTPSDLFSHLQSDRSCLDPETSWSPSPFHTQQCIGGRGWKVCVWLHFTWFV